MMGACGLEGPLVCERARAHGGGMLGNPTGGASVEVREVFMKEKVEVPGVCPPGVEGPPEKWIFARRVR